MGKNAYFAHCCLVGKAGDSTYVHEYANEDLHIGIMGESEAEAQHYYRRFKYVILSTSAFRAFHK